MKYATYLALAACLLLPKSGFAAGIQVSPSKLEFSVQKGQSQSQEVTVVNPTGDVQLFEAFPDDFGDSISISPTSFTLESGARKTVTVTATPGKANLSQGEILSTNISFVGKPLADSGVQVGTGVKLPATVSIAAKNPALADTSIWLMIGGGLAAVLAAGAILFRKHKKRA